MLCHIETRHHGRWAAALMVVVVIVTVALGAEAQQQKAPADHQKEAPSEIVDPGVSPLDIKEKKIDQAGEKVGQGIEALATKASSALGHWTDAEVFLGIQWTKLMFCLAAVILVILFERVLRALLQRKIETLPSRDGAISWRRILFKALVRPLSLLIWAYGIYGALSPLFGHFKAEDGSNLIHAVAQRAADMAVTIAIVWFFYGLVIFLDERLKRWASTTESSIDDILVPLVGKTLRGVILLLGGIIILKSLTGLEVGPLLASLGIGGLAVALAAKDSVANFFGTLTILLDKPFQVGERIVIDNYDGVVEEVGFRSSRIRTLTGHLVTIPNEKLVNSTVENIGKRPHIRWLTNIGITYDTPPEKVEEAVRILETIIVDHEGLHPDFPPRVFFNGFNDWSLNIMVLLWYHPANYWDFQVFIQRICLEILGQFREAGIDFAFPSRTVYAAGDDKRLLKMMLTGAEDVPIDIPGR